MRAYMYTIPFLVLLLFFTAFSFVYATEVSVTPQILFSPKYPQPGQTTTARVILHNKDLRTASIVWLLNTKVQQQRVGGTSFTFTIPRVTVPQTLGVLIKPLSGAPIASTITIYPSQVTLLWEGNTYTPPFYEGKKLYSPGATIRAEAVTLFRNANGIILPNTDLVYTWSKNGVVLGDKSGIGANTLITSGPAFLGTDILSVSVTTQNKAQYARSSVEIKTTKPIIRLYQSDPLTGIAYNKALEGKVSIAATSQLELQAVPYFAVTTLLDSPVLNYIWSINSKKVVPTNIVPSKLTIPLKVQQNGIANIRVSVTNLLHLLQNASNSISITFSDSTKNSLFGL